MARATVTMIPREELPLNSCYPSRWCHSMPVTQRPSAIDPLLPRSDMPKPNFKPPKPIRSKKHLRWVAEYPCMLCGGPSQAHHLRIGLRTMGVRVCDSKTVPLCFQHHAELHEGREEDFWEEFPRRYAAMLWNRGPK
jgi:hypothetical protein